MTPIVVPSVTKQMTFETESLCIILDQIKFSEGKNMIPIENERSTFGGLIRINQNHYQNTKVCTETVCSKIKTNGETSIL